MERSEALERFELLEPRVGSGGARRMINVLEPASLVNGLNKSNALPALVDKRLGITTEIYTHVAIRKVKTSARENASTSLKALTLIDRYVPMRMLVP